jgi:tetrahydromethanopterin S-methyltransferase subunit E
MMENVMAGRAAFLGLIGVGLATLLAAAAPAAAQSDACRPGFVPRLANPQDQVCVAPQIGAEVEADNAAAAQRRAPGGGEACLLATSGGWRTKPITSA